MFTSLANCLIKLNNISKVLEKKQTLYNFYCYYFLGVHR